MYIAKGFTTSFEFATFALFEDSSSSLILSLMYSQSFFILCEDNDKGIVQCMKESAAIMKGHKWEFFILQLSFILWLILGAITCGIAMLWVSPYMYVTYANYYKSLNSTDA